jgi:hypothetical protein
MAAFLDPGAWGREFADGLGGYANMAGMWIVGEDMPQATNRVTLNADVKDRFGMSVPNVHYDDHENDMKMREHAFQRGEEIHKASGA